MSGGVDFGQLCVISSVQVCGLVSAVLARITEGRRGQDLSQRMFLACLVVVAFTTVLNVWNAPQQWVASAVTLTVMIVTATCDFSHPL